MQNTMERRLTNMDENSFFVCKKCWDKRMFVSTNASVDAGTKKKKTPNGSWGEGSHFKKKRHVADTPSTALCKTISHPPPTSSRNGASIDSPDQMIRTTFYMRNPSIQA